MTARQYGRKDQHAKASRADVDISTFGARSEDAESEINYLNAHYAIRGRHLIATNAYDFRRGPVCEIRFATGLADDDASVSGRYRMAGHEQWNTFRFTKTDDAVPNYTLSLPLTDAADASGTLTYFVPAGEVLNREYVFQALLEVYGDGGDDAAC